MHRVRSRSRDRGEGDRGSAHAHGSRHRSRSREHTSKRTNEHREHHRSKRSRSRSRSHDPHRSSHSHRRHDHRGHYEKTKQIDRPAVPTHGSTRDEIIPKSVAPAPGVVPIDSACMGSHARAFSTWLASVGRPPLTDLLKEDARALFEREFVPLWNENRLPPAVVNAQAGGAASLSSAHTWGFVLSAADEERLAAATEDVAAAESGRGLPNSRPLTASAVPPAASRIIGPARPPGR